MAHDILFDRGGPTHVEGGWIHHSFRHIDPREEVHRAAIIFSTPPDAERPVTAGLFVKVVNGKVFPYTPREVKGLVEKSLHAPDLTLKKRFISRFDQAHVYEFESTVNNMYITLTEKNGLLRFNSARPSEKPADISKGNWRKIEKGEYKYRDGEITFP